ncbi:MAG: enoyl-CoA hydratase/isomerase family protein [Pyrinomonadaceae bacterium]
MSNRSTPVVYEIDGTLARITLNRPEKRNALNDELIAMLKDALGLAGSAADVRAVILTGAGPDFCAGADLSALKKISSADVTKNAADARSLLELLLQIRNLEVPVIAAVRGRALAGGCGLATACDLVLASDSARFGYPEVKLGFVPAIVLAILRRNVSEKRAFELTTRGDEITAREAQSIGLVNRVFSDEAFDAEVTTYASRFSSLSKSAVAFTKKLLYQVDGLQFSDALATGADVNIIARLTEDCQKGIARFLDKT